MILHWTCLFFSLSNSQLEINDRSFCQTEVDANALIHSVYLHTQFPINYVILTCHFGMKGGDKNNSLLLSFSVCLSFLSFYTSIYFCLTYFLLLTKTKENRNLIKRERKSQKSWMSKNKTNKHKNKQTHNDNPRTITKIEWKNS